jgi:uracil-DNA glycosylase family 4
VTTEPALEIRRKHPLAECERCPIREVGRYVPSQSPASGYAKVAFVGEAPGKMEAREGRPFTGPSGKLLNVVMNHHGIHREESFLSNACSCRPPDNATPPPAAIVACRPRLLRELEGVGADTVVALGNSAAQSLLGKIGITKLRVGPAKQSQYLPGVRIIPTIHPAAALRQADNFPFIVTDVGKVVASNELWIEPKYYVADTVGDALQVISELEEREGPLVVDIEVDIEKDTSHDHPNHYGMLCVGIAYARDRAVVLGESVMESQQVRDALGKLLRGKHLIGQNLKFDLAGLYPILGPLKGWFDTMLASYCFDERPGIHSLDFQGIEYLGTPDWKHALDQYNPKKLGYGVIPRPVLYKYNAYDVCVTYQLWEYWERRFIEDEANGPTQQIPGIEYKSLRYLHDKMMEWSNELMYMELNGISVDKEHLRKLEVKYLEDLEHVRDEIKEIIGYPINPNSPMQVQKYWKSCGVNSASTDATHCEYILTATDSHNPRQAELRSEAGEDKTLEVHNFTAKLLDHRALAKQYGTYVKGIRKRLYGGRVFSSYRLHGTTTGRLASRNPNMQNIPRLTFLRDLFVPSKAERVFVQADYSQAELRVLSFYARDTYFRDIFAGGDRDLFDELTPILYPKAGPKPDAFSTAQQKAAWKELRIRVKAFVYGLAYGRTEFSIAIEFGIPVSEAKMLKERFFAVIPEIVEFQTNVKNAVFAGHPLITAFGRRRRFPLITNENVKEVTNEALAFLPQSTSSDICLGAMAQVRRDLKGKGWIRNIVHDSILAECHEDDAEEVGELLNRRMIESAYEIVGDWVPFATETKIGRSWGAV